MVTGLKPMGGGLIIVPMMDGKVPPIIEILSKIFRKSLKILINNYLIQTQPWLTPFEGCT
jgi:hypothetical protein